MGVFRFKKFSVDDTGCAMKTGTDAVLLGAWAPLPVKGSVLDIGCGSGIISLMIAQRNPALKITALDIDQGAALQAAENFRQFPLKIGHEIICSDAESFAKRSKSIFELIVCNPPYFRNSLKGKDNSRNLARHDAALNIKSLSSCASSLLSGEGSLCVIIPAELIATFRNIAAAEGLFMSDIVNVHHQPGKSAVRSLARFNRFRTVNIKESGLVITDVDNSFTADYLNLTRDFYLFA